MRTELFDYQLPEELIAQRPAEKRDRSRMLVLDRATGECQVREFADIVEYLQPGDLLVSNNTKVMRARLYGRKNGLPEGAHFEALLLNPHPAGEIVPGCRYQAMLKPGKRAVPGTRVVLLDHAGNLLDDAPSFTVAERLEDGTFVIDFDTPDQEALQEKFAFDFVGVDFIRDGGRWVLNEIEDIVGSRMLYKTTDLDVASLYIKHVAKSVKAAQG